jgi:hypothetical protein
MRHEEALMSVARNSARTTVASLSLFVLLLGLALLAPGSASAASEVDQQQTAGGTLFNVAAEVGAVARAQTFTAGRGGELDHVELFLGRTEGVTEPLEVDVTAALPPPPHEPGGSTLATASIPAASIPTEPGWVSIAFTGAKVKAGEQYALVVTSNQFPLFGKYFWGGSKGRPYLPGTAWVAPDDGTWEDVESGTVSMTFKTYVTRAALNITSLLADKHEIDAPSITVEEGEPVTDEARLEGENVERIAGESPPENEVIYMIYSNSQCTALRAAGGSGKVTSLGSAAPSLPVTLPAGTYYWRAEYFGGANNERAFSQCAPMTVVKAPEEGGHGGRTAILTKGGELPLPTGSSEGFRFELRIAGLATSCSQTFNDAVLVKNLAPKDRFSLGGSAPSPRNASRA